MYPRRSSVVNLLDTFGCRKGSSELSTFHIHAPTYVQRAILRYANPPHRLGSRTGNRDAVKCTTAHQRLEESLEMPLLHFPF